jgi:hypothetical protein
LNFGETADGKITVLGLHKMGLLVNNFKNLIRFAHPAVAGELWNDGPPWRDAGEESMLEV